MELLTSIRHNAILRALPDRAQARLCEAATSRHLTRGDRVWARATPVGGVALVCTGVVLVALPAFTQGADIGTDLYGARDLAGLDDALHGIEHTTDATALSSVRLVDLPCSVLLEELSFSPQAAMCVAKEIARRSQSVARRLRAQSADVERRIAMMLLDLYATWGDDDTSDGTHHIPLRLQRRDQASLVGTSVETLIRTMSKFARDGIVTQDAEGTIVIAKLDALRSIADRTIGRATTAADV